MGTTIGSAELDIVPSVAGFKKKLDGQLGPQLKKSGAKAGDRLGSGLAGGIKKHLVGIGASIAAAFAVKKVITSSINAFKDWTLGVIQMKRVAGGSVAGVSRLRFAMQESGVDTTKATTALGIFAKKLGATNGDVKKTAVLTDMLGFSYRNAAGHIKPMTVLLPKLADKFKGMPDGPEKSALAMQLFGKSGRDLLPFLNKGSAGIADLRKESDRLGLTISQKAVDKFAAYKAATREWDASLQGLRVSLGGAILPSLTRFNQFLTRNVGPGVEKLRLWIKTSPGVKQASKDVSLGLANISKWARNEAAPAIAGFIRGMQNGTGAGGALAGSLRNLLGVGRGVVNIFRAMPAPVTKTIVKVTLAAIAVNRLQGAINAVKTSAFVSSMTAAATATEAEGVAASATSGRMAMLGGVMKLAAGVGGILAVTDASNRSSKAMGLLEGAAGGAATGFAVGGPWGAAIGAAAGGLLGVFSSGKKAASGINASTVAAQESMPQIDGLSSSLDVLSRKYTKAQRAAIAAAVDPKAYLAGNRIGLNRSTVAGAAAGNPADRQAVAAAIAKETAALKANGYEVARNGDVTNKATGETFKGVGAVHDLVAALGPLNSRLRSERAAAIQMRLETTGLGKALRGIPDDKVIKIGTEGKKMALKDITDLTASRKLSDRQIELLLKLGGITDAKNQVNSVRAAAQALAARQYSLHFKATLDTSALNKRGQYGGIDGDPTTPRAMGGPVRKGQPYIVGERRPELFVPDQSGRIESRVPTTRGTSSAAASSGPVQLAGDVNLSIGDLDFEAYINALIDDRVGT